ncbi:hypothetical protein ACIF8W_28365 [Streptomyces sp. NPDC085639]|uniref:hypothetical protein n=1 Tax=Streptomyces sp. NPDC085639 TaxID=3365734 RepID=UPI0037D3A7F3
MDQALRVPGSVNAGDPEGVVLGRAAPGGQRGDVRHEVLAQPGDGGPAGVIAPVSVSRSGAVSMSCIASAAGSSRM